jgi:predicted RND superfamily exporter protein
MDSDAKGSGGNALANWLTDVRNKEWYVKSSAATRALNEKIESTIEVTWEKAHGGLDRLYATILEMPKVTVALMIIMAAWFGWVGSDFQSLIEDDVEIFLPEGADSTELLLEVREEWTTDVAIIYIQSSNARIGGGEGDNITEKQILEEISWVEGDEDNRGAGENKRGVDWDKEDHGRNDGALWVISIAQVVKEVNSSDGRFNVALCDHGLQSRIGIELDCEERNEQIGTGGEYTIPDQEKINEILEQAQELVDSLVKDTNDDGIYDTTAIIIGMNHDMSTTGEYIDFESYLNHIDDIINLTNRPNDMRLTTMTLTGLTKVLEDVSEEIFEDLKEMMPISLLLVVVVVTVLHRSWKIVVITGLPICMALAVTFGSAVLLDMTLTPMIVATGPILIGLGVDYSLHMINRIEESRNRIIDRENEENYERRKRGEGEEGISELWDPHVYRQAVLEMTKTTGVAVFFSAMTTIIGFSVMIMPQIVPVIPIRSVGMTLCIGIFATLIFSIILVPTLGWLLRFHKRENPLAWGKISQFPIKHFGVVLVIAGIITAYGAYILEEEMNKPITGSSDAPDGIISLETLATYSEQFGSGQTSMFIFDAEERGDVNNTKAIRDLPVLDAMDRIEQKVAGIEHTNTTSVITFFKSIPVNVELVGGVSLYQGSLWDFLHDECWESNDPVECNVWLALDATGPEGREGLRKDLVNVAFDTLSSEVKWMLLNEADSKSLVYVTQPYMNLIYAGGLRDQIDEILLKEPEEPGTKATKLTGGLPVSLDINKGIHDTQAYTTIVTLLVLILVLTVVFRSPRLGLYTMIPVAVVILWQPLLMRSGDVNVNIFTAMIGTIVFGIGVDDAIHVMHRIREEGETAVGMTKAVEHTGQTIFETSLTTVAGMAAGFFVSFPGLENFFVVMMLLIGFAFLTSAFLLPAVLTAHHKVLGALLGKEKWGDLEGSPSLDNAEVVEVELLADS